MIKNLVPSCSCCLEVRLSWRRKTSGGQASGFIHNLSLPIPSLLLNPPRCEKEASHSCDHSHKLLQLPCLHQSTLPISQIKPFLSCLASGQVSCCQVFTRTLSNHNLNKSFLSCLVRGFGRGMRKASDLAPESWDTMRVSTSHLEGRCHPRLDQVFQY